MGRKMVDTTASVCAYWDCWCVVRLKMRPMRSPHSADRDIRSSQMVLRGGAAGGGARVQGSGGAEGEWWVGGGEWARRRGERQPRAIS